MRGVLELASLERFNPSHQAFLDQLTESIGIVINTIEANTRTEDLLTQSQSLAEELQSRQEELQQTNEELQEKARLLAHQNQEVERKNHGGRAGPPGAGGKGRAAGADLEVQVRVPGQHVARAAHAAEQPADPVGPAVQEPRRQPDAASRSSSPRRSTRSGNDLLMLINDILDLSKIESGTVAVDVSELRLDDLQRYVERSFRHFAESKHVDFEVQLEPAAAARSMVTDVKRLQQIIKNLLSNAFKFTHAGPRCRCTIAQAPRRLVAPTTRSSTAPSQVIAFSVRRHRHRHLARQAADHLRGVPAGRRLDLAQVRRHRPRPGDQPRAVARCSAARSGWSARPAQGSTFTLYLPQSYSPARVRAPRPPRGQRRAGAEPASARRRATAPAPPRRRGGARRHRGRRGLDARRRAVANVADDDRDDISPATRCC